MTVEQINIANQNSFVVIVDLIKQSRQKAFSYVNTELINLYWNIGEFISKKTLSDGWGKSTVEDLAKYIQKEMNGSTGFSSQNLWRMKQLYETYSSFPILSPLVRELSWTNNLQILSKTKSIEEKEFYINLCLKEKYSKRELGRQIDSGLYERVLLSKKRIDGNLIDDFKDKKKKLSPVVTEIGNEENQQIINVFKDTYIFEFLDLPVKYGEKDLRNLLVRNLKNFILEIGKEFTFVGDEYRIQISHKDFFVDLLLYHRGLQCLVAVELKIDEFKPDYLGQMNFYLEVLDQNIKLPHENPSIGLLLCKTKDDEIVKIAMNRNVSPTKIAEYETKLINKNLLKKKLHELGEYYLTDEKS